MGQMILPSFIRKTASQLMTLTLLVVALSLAVTSTSLAEPGDDPASWFGNTEPLYTINNSRSVQDPPLPMAQSVQEWAIDFDWTRIRQATASFSIDIPGDLEADRFVASLSHFTQSSESERSWIGELRGQSDPNKVVGEIFVVVLEDRPFAIFSIEGQSYEIFTDLVVGTRLMKVKMAHTLDAVAPHSGFATDKGNPLEAWIPPSSKLLGGGAPAASVLDVLVLIDDDFLSSPGLEQSIRDKIQVERAFAAAVLRLSSSAEGRGIPIYLNIVGIEPMDIPDELETTECNSFCTDSTHATLANDEPYVSTINALRDQYGADFVAVYIHFTPVFVAGSRQQPCGIAAVPLNTSDDQILANSLTFMADGCTGAQLVFLHELMHNFGSHHFPSAQSPAFTPYAYGFLSEGPNPDQATIMRCSLDGDTGPFDPSTVDCNRIFRMSSPNDTYDGFTIGDAQIADNARFLTECKGPCRRDQLENRKDRVVPPANIPPSATIESPVDGSTIMVSPNFTLLVDADDPDSQSIEIDWFGNTVGTTDGFFLGSGSSVQTDLFDTVGEYFVTVIVTDTEGATTVDAVTVTVVDLMADAGDDQRVGLGAIVTLDGTGSAGAIASYSWEEIGSSGGGVCIKMNTAVATCFLPDFIVDPGPYDLSFRLTVTDSSGASDSDDMVVHVNSGGCTNCQ